MSVVTLGDNAPKLASGEIITLSSKANLAIKKSYVDDFARLLGALDQSVKSILESDDYVPKPDLARYQRTDITIPKGSEETDQGGWAIRCIGKSISPLNSLLKDRTVALKDNVALAGVKCTNGTAAMDWTPELDATVATRIMDAGGVITGKAACENACLEGVSDTSVTGKVHNPFANDYSCGGSSSGSGRLVATGSADMAIGCDQGGSIRIPASMCGVGAHC
jgi:amidase